MNETIHTLIDEKTLENRIHELGAMLSEKYAGKSLHLICVLKGGVMFMTELAKYITVPVTMDFMMISSYGSDTKSSGKIKIVQDTSEPVEGRDVLIVEDIVDSGRSLKWLRDFLSTRNPASLAICTMLDKPSRRVVEVPVEYTGFKIDDLFIVGYGLDYDQRYRNLRYIGYIDA